MQCPDHPRELAPNAQGRASCPSCSGLLLDATQARALAPAVFEALAPESDRKSGAFAKVRHCPQCASEMAPLRIAKAPAWIEHCAGCDLYWLDKLDTKTLEMLEKSRAREAAVQSMPKAERAQIASDLAGEAKVSLSYEKGLAPLQGGPSELSGLEVVLAFFGVPVVRRTEGDRAPIVTLALAAAILGVFLLGKVDPGSYGVEVLAYDAGHPTVLTAFSSVFAHFGWFHLLVNLGFLVAFGEAVEQKLPRVLMLAAFFLQSGVGSLAEATFGSGTGLIGGASDSIAMLMGATFVLQRRARVFVLLLGKLPLDVPILAYGAFQLCFEALMAVIGAPGAAWWAHLSGLACGVALGFAFRERRENVPSPAPVPVPVAVANRPENSGNASPWSKR